MKMRLQIPIGFTYLMLIHMLGLKRVFMQILKNQRVFYFVYAPIKCVHAFFAG